jgi:lipoprotein-anchoring transpeptidase ErfK/SrfK
MKTMKKILIGVFVLLVAVLAFKTLQPLRTKNPLAGEFHGSIVYAPSIEPMTPDSIETNKNVLGDSTGKRIEVNLSTQRVLAYEGNTKVNEFVVSTGLWGRTPTGTFTIQRKVRSQTMSGGNRAIGTYYYLPGVPWVQFFGNDQIPWSRGFSFHGTYWHNNFGHPMSHGCVNMKTPEAQWLFDWAPMGTTVSIYGNTPTS